MKTVQPYPQTKNRFLFNVILILGLGILLGAEIYFGYNLHKLSNQQEQLKEDYSTVNNITFGLFSVDLWTEKLSSVVKGKIKDFKVTAEQKQEVKEQIEKQLHVMVDQVTKEFNKPQKSIGGKLKKFAFKQFVNPKELHAQVPSFSKTIVTRLFSPRATKKLKNIANSEFQELADQTYDSTKIAIDKVTKIMFTKYHVKDQQAFNKQIETHLKDIRVVTYNYAYAMLGALVLVFLVWILLRKRAYLQTSLFVMSLLIALTMLVVGFTVSIIEVDARLDTLELEMMGEKIAFHNQVLFYQSKSIQGIGEILIQQPKPDSVTVGVLIFLFVLVLPMLRIIARGLHMSCKPPIAENKVIKYLAFESGKWDMADVMVVGILMTYIGLNGILKSQLTDLNIKNEFLTTSTVNYTSLQPGYIIFVGYVAFGFVLSYMLKKITTGSCELPEPIEGQDPK